MFFSFSLKKKYFYGFLRDFNGFHSKESESQIMKLAYVATHRPELLKPHKPGFHKVTCNQTPKSLNLRFHLV